MPDTNMSAERLTEIVASLRPSRRRRLPESLTAAATQGDVAAMQLFLDRGANLEERSVGTSSPLGAACRHGQAEAARWLIARGAQLDQPDDTQSPISHALGKANCEVAAVLLDAGLPIERAAWGAVATSTLGRLDVLHWLVGRGLDLDRSYPKLGVLRERALRSARKDAADLVRYLKGELDAGPPPSPPPGGPPQAAPVDGSSLLQEGIDLVRAAGRSAARWDVTGRAAPPQRQRLVSFASGAGVVELVEALLDAGASPNEVPDGTPPPLSAASGEAQVDVARLLLKRGALPNGADGKSWLPLVGAVQSGDPEMVKLLLESGANPKANPAGGFKLAEHVRGPHAQEIRDLLARGPAKRAPR